MDRIDLRKKKLKIMHLKDLLIICLLILSIPCFAQKIEGKVVDASNSQGVPFCHIYYPNTFIGTSADENGNFKIKDLGFPLAISAVGYESIEIAFSQLKSPLLIKLNQRVNFLDEVAIEVDRKQNSQDLELFKKIFLGDNPAGRQCIIINEDDIFLHRKGDILVAKSEKPLIIQNPYLGYRLKYYLSDFRFTPDIITINGSAFFEDVDELDKTIARRRRRTFLHSRERFIHSLLGDSLGTSGYMLYDRTNQRIPRDSILAKQPSGEYFLRTDLLVIKGPIPSSTSYLITNKKDSVFILQNGYFDPKELVWNGFLSQPKIGDLLPKKYE